MISWRSPNIISQASRFLPWIILANVTYFSFVSVISATGGFITDSTVRGALMLSSDNERWISISFIMMLGITLPYAIWLAERFGYKLLFFLGGGVFLLGSLLNGLSFDFWSLLVSRAVAGAGAGALFPLSIALINQNFPKDLIDVAVPLYIGIGFGGATFFAFLSSGYLIQYVSWQSLFLLCFVLSIPALIATWLFHPETEANKDVSFDHWGYGTFILFIASLFLILNSAKAEWNTGGWTSPFILTCTGLAVLSLAVFIPLELKHPNPIINFALFKHKTFFLGCMTIIFVGAILYANQILNVVFCDFDLRYEKHRIGLFLAPQGLFFGFFGAIVAVLAKKVSIRLLTLIGMVMVTISCYLGAYFTIYSSHEQLFWTLALRNTGIGLSLGPATALALLEIPKALSGAAAVLIILCRQIGGTLGTLGADVIIIERTIFHSNRFGSQMEVMSPRFEQVAERLQTHLIHNVGAVPEEAKTQALDMIRGNVMIQAHATAINDSFLILGGILGVITLGLIIEALWSQATVTSLHK